MDDEQPRQELVKCVLVGDNAVGKTRLVCARACRQKVSLSQLLNTHVPTVWAIDQYRIYKEVLENSMMVLDGVNVSLRLWDTFGDHHKDRRFAYGRSDVVLMCFDVGRLSSLENCREMWIQQIRKFCPNTPILLVGCKNDVRFIFSDEQYLNYCKERSPLVRQVREKDLVMSEQGRAVARELGLPYYETSVLTYFGVNEVFENAIRAALCARRQQRFWMTNLRKVLMPTLQEPFCPPRPALPGVQLLPSVYQEDRKKLFQQQHFTDVILICGSVGFSAHRFLLCAFSPLLQRILTTDYSIQPEPPPTRSNSETSLLSSSLGSSTFCVGGGCGDFASNDDTEQLLGPCSSSSEQSTPSRAQQTNKGSPAIAITSCIGQSSHRYQRRRRSNSFHLSASSMMGHWSEASTSASTSADASKQQHGICRQLNHPGLVSYKVQQCESLDSRGRVVTSLQTILTCSKLITPKAMVQVARFLYTGQVDVKMCEMEEVKQAAEFLNIPDLHSYATSLKKNKKAKDKHNLAELQSEVTLSLQRGLEDVCLVQNLFCDVIFRLDDGALSAHKPVLMARCDMMQAMFTHQDFVESSARVVKFPGIRCSTFEDLLYYLYTDRSPPNVVPQTCVAILELANRLCLPRLISLVEESVIAKLTDMIDAGNEVTEEALMIVQPCQVHNADQLNDWCLSYLAQNYNYICRKYPKVLRNLHPENQAWLNVHRWPPIWYLKDHDIYQRMVIEKERHEKPKNLKRTRANSGCLCFSSKASRRGGSTYCKNSS